MDPKTLLLIAMGMCGGFIEPTRPGICSAEGDPPAGGGGGGDPPKTFTQAEVDALIAQRIGREKKAAEKQIADATAAAATKSAELEAKLAELTEQVALAGKSGAEKAAAEKEREARAHQTKLDNASKEKAAAEARAKELEDKLAAATKARHLDALKTTLQAELLKQKASPSTIADAVDLFLLRGKVEFDEAGKPTIEGFGGTYTEPAAAAKAFLAASPAYASHPGGGNGTKHTGVGLPGGSTLDALVAAGDANALLRSGGARLLTPSSVAVDQAEKDALAPGR